MSLDFLLTYSVLLHDEEFRRNHCRGFRFIPVCGLRSFGAETRDLASTEHIDLNTF